MVSKGVIIILNIFQHDEQMVVYKPRFFVIIFPDFKEQRTLKVNNFISVDFETQVFG